MTAIKEVDFQRACDSYMGWCTECKKFTGECVEPDDEHYECPVCGNMSVMGAEQALVAGEITF